MRLRTVQNATLKGQRSSRNAQNSKTLVVYKQQQNTTAMPTVYKNKGEKNLWSDEQLHTAMEAVSSGELKAHAAAKQYGMPSRTLYDHIKGKSTKRYVHQLSSKQKKRRRWGNFGHGVTPGILHLECCSFLER